MSIETLRWKRLLEPKLIPEELIEEVRGRTYSVEEFYEFQEINKTNPGNLLFILYNKDNAIKGYLWANMNVLDESLFVNTFSISKEYWGKGEGLDLAIKFLNDLQKKINAKRVLWISTNKRFFIKKGFRESKNVLLEYIANKEEKKDGTTRVSTSTNNGTGSTIAI